MMAKKYEPGTAAIATVFGVPNVRVFRSANGWQSDEQWLSDGEVTDVRPLVVLDLADYEWLPNRLRFDADRISGETGRKMRHLADQIEAQAQPPKPAEPTGLGAVVEDTEGDLWIRSSTSGLDAWRREGPRGSINQTWFVWAEVNAVRVLSEGVSA